MRKYKKAKIVFEDKAIDKKRKPIYATRKLSIGLVSCMLGVMLFVPTSKADEENPLPTSEQIEKNVQPEQTQDLEAGLEETTNDKTPENNQEELLTADEIQEIRNRTYNLKNSYFFNGNMVEELKAELRKAKADLSVNYEEAKASLINEAILKNTPAQKAPGEDRAVRNFNIKDAEKLEAGMTEINVRGLGMETGQIIEVLVNGEVKGTFTQPKSVKNSVKITLSEALKENDKVKAILKGSNGVQIAATDEYTVKKAKPKLAEQYKNDLKMPNGEIWIEQYVANIVNEEEKAKALDILKKANTTEIANDIKDIDFKIEGVDTKTASYTVTYKDNSQTEKILAPTLTIKQVTEYSAATNVEKLVVTDTKITGKLVPQKKVGEGKFEPDPNGKIAEGTKVIAILNPSGNDGSANYCTTGKCSTDKNSSTIGEATVNSDGTFEINVPDGFDYKQEVGLTVKEPHKFKACNSTTVEYVIPKVLVRDPKKLTDEEKKTIEDEIRKANTIVKGDGSKISKLPDWTVYNIPAYIDIDKDGNVKIINPAEVDGDWIDDYTKFVPKRNPDGSLKMSTGNENSGIPVTKEELLENKAPDAPTISTNVDDGKITITPNPLDTDAKKIEVKYTDPKGVSKTATATKGDNGEWSVPEGSDISVDKTSGVVTITFDKIKNKTNVDAKVTDDGGIANNDKDKKTSDNKSETIRVLPKKPDIKVDKNTGDVTITPIEKKSDRVAKKMDVTYTPAGETESKTVTFERDDEGKWSVEGKTDFEVSEDGKTITIKNNKIKANTDIKAKTNDADETDKLESEENQATIQDKTAPQPPTVEVNTGDGSAQIKPPTDKDTKTVTVKYPDPNGSEKTAIATKENDGWKITQGGDDGVTVDSTSGIIKIPYGKMKKADTVSATAKDESKNESQSSTDTTLPPVPNVEVNTDKKVVVTPPADTPAVNGMEITYTPAGESKAKTINIVKDNEGNWKLVGDSITGISVESSGKVTFDKGIAKELSNVTAKSKIDENKKGLETAEKQVPDTTAPEKPEVKVQKDGSVTITPKKDSDTKTVTVTYKDNEGNEKTAIATKGDDGWKMEKAENGETVDSNGVITIPTGKSNPGDVVKATAKDPSDNESGPSDDTTMPAPPTITPDQESGDVTITPPTKGNLDGMDIEYQTPSGEKRTVRVKKDNSKWTIEGDNPDKVTVVEGTGLVTIPKGKAKEKTEVVAKSTLGEKKAPAEKTPEKPNLVPDKTAPNPPTVKVEDNGSVTITPPKDEDTTSVTVTYKKADNTEIKVKAKKAGNKWSLTKEDGTSPVDNGESVDENSGVITLEKGKYKTGEIVTAFGNDNVDNKSTDGENTPVEVRFDLGASTKKLEAKILAKGGSYVLPASLEKEYYPEGMVFDGWEIDGNPQKAGKSIQINANTTVKAVWKDIEYKVSFNGNTGTGKMDEKLVKKGNEYVLPENGFTAPEGKKFDGWMIGTEKKAVGDKIKVNADTEVKAVWKDIEYKVSFNGNTGTGKMDEKLVKKGGKYKLPENKFQAPNNKEFKTWEVDGKEVAVGTEITVDKDTEIKAVWKYIEYKVSFDGNKGSGTMTGATVKKDEKYKLPDNTFGAPSDKQEFKAWEVDGKEVAPGTEITVEKDTEVKAIWKDKKADNPSAEETVKVNYNANGGSGEMKGATQKKGSKYILSANSFKAPANKEFKAWEVNGKEVAAGTEITLDKDIEVKAIWKDKASTQNPNKPEKTKPSESVAKTKRKIEVKHTTPGNKEIKNVKTGVESVAGAAAGLIAAAGGLFVSKKRKK